MNSSLTTPSHPFERAMARFDEVHAQDPTMAAGPSGTMPAELLYASRMLAVLVELDPEASDTLKLAANAQHLGRWQLKRSAFPEGRTGYLKWRASQTEQHADDARRIALQAGYDSEAAEQVGEILRGRGTSKTKDAQTLEDVACLVFLRHYWQAFADKHADEKLTRIVKKTWAKMSDRGQALVTRPADERSQRIFDAAGL